MEYYDVARRWTRKVIPHLGDVELNNILVCDFNKFTYGTWRKRFTLGQYPHDYDPGDWFLFHRGRLPRYFLYTCYTACHWLVNFNLRLAALAEPHRPWRIIRSDRHSSVWDGERTLFDLNFTALGVPPQECFDLAFDKELRVGRYRRVYYAPYWKDEIRHEPSPSVVPLMTF